MSAYSITIQAYGDQAVLISWPKRVEEEILYDILNFKQFLAQTSLREEGWELVPAYNSLTLIRDREISDFTKLKAALQRWYAQERETQQAKRQLWRLPVCYDPEFGIDLEETANYLKLDVAQLIALHSSHIYTVFGIGFLPGFMYLGGLPSTLEIPRRSSPRLQVSKGSVGLAGKQTGIYPQDSPGGWNIIGNCPIPIFNLKRDKPCFVEVGDRIQFYSIPRAAYDLHRIEAEVGIFNVEPTLVNAQD